MIVSYYFSSHYLEHLLKVCAKSIEPQQKNMKRNIIAWCSTCSIILALLLVVL